MGKIVKVRATSYLELRDMYPKAFGIRQDRDGHFAYVYEEHIQSTAIERDLFPSICKINSPARDLER